MKVVVHVDGGARGNPGPAAAAAVVSTPDGDVARRGRTSCSAWRRTTSPSTAALLLGLERARELGADEVEVVNDSELVAKQVNGEYKVKHPDMKPLHARGAGGARARSTRWTRALASRARRTPTPTRSSTRRSTRRR